MKFEWDEGKNKINLQKHGIDFNDVAELFNQPMLVLLDSRDDYGEERWIGIGILFELVCVTVYTERKGDIIRIISARKATKREAVAYAKTIKN